MKKKAINVCDTNINTHGEWPTILDQTNDDDERIDFNNTTICGHHIIDD
jgi:hypothetical protein